MRENKLKYYHKIQVLLFIITLFVLAASFYFEYYEGLKPCALCLMQRFMVIILAILFLLNIFLKRISHLKLLLPILFSAFGLFFAGRQVWLQVMAPPQTTCLPGIATIMQYMPWQDVVKVFLLGTKDCAEISWRWLGITMPGWSFFYFAAVFLLTVGMWIKYWQTK